MDGGEALGGLVGDPHGPRERQEAAGRRREPPEIDPVHALHRQVGAAVHRALPAEARDVRTVQTTSARAIPFLWARAAPPASRDRGVPSLSTLIATTAPSASVASYTSETTPLPSRSPIVYGPKTAPRWRMVGMVAPGSG